MKKIILVAGGTASGKTMIASILQKEYKEIGVSCTLLSMDNYYKDLDELPEETGPEVNWDDPSVFDWESFENDVEKLYNGEDVYKKAYSFEKFCHPGEEELHKSSDVIIIEGLYTLYSEKIRSLASSKIFVHADDDIRLIRRIKRDSEGRYKQGFNQDIFMRKWINEVQPMYKKHIKPTSEYSDFIIKNNQEFVGEEKERMINLLHSLMVK